MNVHAIIFSDDAVLIEYTDDTPGPFPVSSQISVPYREAQLHTQLHQDLQEVMQDAETLLDSVMVARMKNPAPPREMGRE